MTIYYLNHLPPELWTNILCNHDLPLLTFGKCQKVCTLFNQIVNEAETNWEKWANVLDKDNQWKPVYICKSLRNDFTWKRLIIDFKTTEKQTLKSIFDRFNYTTNLKQSLEKTQYHELTPFLHSDNGETLSLLGESFLYGKGCSKNEPKAIKYFKKAANKKYAHAQYYLGLCYEKGVGCPQDETQALRYYKWAAKKGHAGAQYHLGNCYKLGILCLKNLDEAFRYYKWAAKKDHAGAQTELGEYYITNALKKEYTTGTVCKQNIVKDFYYYTLAADQGHVDAQKKLNDYKEEINDGFHYYEEAAKQCSSIFRARQKKLLGAKLYDSLDDSTKQDLDEMVATNPCYLSSNYFKKEIKRITGKYLIYEEGLKRGIEVQIEKKTIKWIFAKANHPILKKILVNTQYHELASMYEESRHYSSNSFELSTLMGEAFLEGKGCNTNPQKAFTCFEQASKYLCANAQYYLGVCYEKGVGCPQDETQALRYYEWAAKKGHAHAQFCLGMCYANGKYYQQDRDQAFKYYKLAAEQGYAPAQTNLGVCYEEGKGCPQDKVKALHCFELATEQGNANAQFNLGVHYEYDQQNLSKALVCYQQAANQRHPGAIKKYDELTKTCPNT